MVTTVAIGDADVAAGRQLARGLESAATDIEVVAVVTTPDDAERVASAQLPDVLLLSVDLAVDLTPVVRQIGMATPSVSIIVLTTGDVDAGYAAIRAGGCGVARKSADATTLVRMIRSAANGVVPLAPGIAARAQRDLDRLRPGALTPSERAVLDGVEAGGGPADVAVALGVPEQQVWRRLADVTAKLQVAAHVAARPVVDRPSDAPATYT